MKIEYTWKWHDVICDPTDLPEHTDQVLVSYEKDADGYYWDYDIGEYWDGDEGWGNVPAPVVAWTYIARR